MGNENKGNYNKETNLTSRMKQLRHELGLSQAQFALKINKTPGFISLIETGRSGISEETISDISKAYNVNEDWLRTGIGEMFLDEGQKEARDTKLEKEKAQQSVAERIHNLRINNKMSINQFASELRCSRNQIVSVENGKRTPTEKFLRRVADAFYVSYDWLITGKEDEIAEDDLDRIRYYMEKDSVAKKVVLEVMEQNRDIWLDIDHLVQERKNSSAHKTTDSMSTKETAYSKTAKEALQ